MMRKKMGVVYATLAVGVIVANARAVGPVPVGTSVTTISYDTTGGPVSFDSVALDYNGLTPNQAQPLVGAPNVRSFNSVNMFGRRMAVVNSGQTGGVFDGVLADNESQIAHAFFKLGDNFGADYFPDLMQDGTITVHVENVTFAEPVTVDPSTIMFHALWTDMQVSQLSSQYLGLHTHHTNADSFRNFDAFAHPSQNILADFGAGPNYILDSDLFSIQIDGSGTNQLDITAQISYEALRHLEEQGQTVPDGLPAPQGFLEPFHFHIEYVVAPDPATLLLLLPGAAMICRRPRRRS